MKIKEQAEELIEKHHQRIVGVVDVNNAFYYAKQCAFVTVDELISSYSQYTGMHDQEFFDSERKYWESVKSELQTL